MKRAILSDIHGNLEALEAVLADVAHQDVDSIYCLGDIVGYGPNPRECLDRVMEFDGWVLGNHDQGALFDPEGFSSGAERAIFWTRQQLENAPDGLENSRRRWDFLLDMPRMLVEPQRMFVHGSARNPLNEYVFPEDVHNPRKMERIFGLIEQACFQGHTHVPGVFTSGGSFYRPGELRYRYAMGADRIMVNVGSVGQPRDGDPRACYVVLTDDMIEFRRVEYPFEKTSAKIYAIPELDNFLGDRLREGK